MKKQYVKPEPHIISLGLSSLIADTYNNIEKDNNGAISKGAPLIISQQINQNSEENTETEGVAGKDGLVYDKTWGVWDDEE